MPNKQKAQLVILELLRKAGEEGIGRTKLYKAFWLAHLYYATDNPGYLTDWPVVKMPQGPGIHEGPMLIQELVQSRQVNQTREAVGPFKELRCRFVGNFLQLALSPAAEKAVTQAYAYVKGLTAAELSEISHDYSRSWRDSAEGEELDIYGDLVPEEEYVERMKDLQLAKASTDYLFT